MNSDRKIERHKLSRLFNSHLVSKNIITLRIERYSEMYGRDKWLRNYDHKFRKEYNIK